ncbi:MAG: NADH-quinone oxidoreductase subunit J [Hydrotalea sp.]|nr:NADH-quinone oxidoreductase subunit J [Hydrotalea sp.]
MMDFAEFIYSLIFWVCALMLVLSAVVVILAQNPVHSVLFLILAFFNAAGLFMLAGAEFLSLLLVVVYVGAVMVLFLFVVMMLDIKNEKARKFFSAYIAVAAMIGLVLLVEMVAVTLAYLGPLQAQQKPGFLNLNMASDDNIKSLGQVIYTDYFVAFEVAGLILLVAMVAAIMLTHRKRNDVRKQVILKQNMRRKEDDIRLLPIENGAGAVFMGRLAPSLGDVRSRSNSLGSQSLAKNKTIGKAIGKGAGKSSNKLKKR